MINKTRLLAGLALGCVLSTPALAEEYRGFYFSVWGGSGSADMPSRRDVDSTFNTAWVQSILDDIADDYNNDPTTVGTLALTDIGRDPSTLDDTTDVWGALVGYRINKWVGTEIGYVNLGEVKYDFDGVLNSTLTPPGTSENFDYTMSYRFDSAGPTAAVVGFLPLGQHFELNAKAGIFLADTRQTIRLNDVEVKENFYHERIDASQTEIFLGIGGTWNATENLALRVEYQKFLDVGDDTKAYEQDFDVINIGVLFR
jgi:opacity protein-like surface antigen